MARTVAIGIQNFEKIRKGNYFYVDKTTFIKEWWESGDEVTLITRPRRFGKTLNMSMVEQFFSLEYAGRSDLFEGLSIWKEEKYHNLQGTWPVINLSFARVKENNYCSARNRICEILRNLYIKFSFIRDSSVLTDADRAFYDCMLSLKIDSDIATSSLYQLSDYLYRYYKKSVIILLDEYDTPMQEAYLHGYWEELVCFMRNLFNSSFKTNPSLARGLMTGITRVSRESFFSDLNHLNIITTTSNQYATTFGFTEDEVFAALKEYNLSEKKDEVRFWYNGFTFGKHRDIYNPWSIINYLDQQEFDTYWANTSSNSLISRLIQQGSRQLKTSFESLLHGETISCSIDEQIVFSQLGNNEMSVFSLLLASGHLKIIDRDSSFRSMSRYRTYKVALTNHEVKLTFYTMVHEWFENTGDDYNDFVKALLIGDIKYMNIYMNMITMKTFSYFDIGGPSSPSAPERFYHGFVLGLLTQLYDRYHVTSNRESGFGRYDVILEPLDKTKDAIILEFKVKDSEEGSLAASVQAALQQIEEKQYSADLLARGFTKNQIKKYGFAFEGKKVLIG